MNENTMTLELSRSQVGIIKAELWRRIDHYRQHEQNEWGYSIRAGLRGILAEIERQEREA